MRYVQVKERKKASSLHSTRMEVAGCRLGERSGSRFHLWLTLATYIISQAEGTPPPPPDEYEIMSTSQPQRLPQQQLWQKI